MNSYPHRAVILSNNSEIVHKLKECLGQLDMRSISLTKESMFDDTHYPKTVEFVFFENGNALISDSQDYLVSLKVKLEPSAKIFFLATESSQIDVDNLSACGCDDVILCPIDKDLLKNKIAKISGRNFYSNMNQQIFYPSAENVNSYIELDCALIEIDEDGVLISTSLRTKTEQILSISSHLIEEIFSCNRINVVVVSSKVDSISGQTITLCSFKDLDSAKKKSLLTWIQNKLASTFESE